MDRDAVERAVDTFINDAGVHIVLDGRTSSSLALRREVQEAKEAFRDSSASESDLLSAAFGLIEAFLRQEWTAILDDTMENLQRERRTPIEGLLDRER